MTTIIGLTTEPQKIDAEVARLIAEATEMVNSGDVRGIAIALVHRDESISTMFSKTDRVGALIGALARLQHRVITILDT